MRFRTTTATMILLLACTLTACSTPEQNGPAVVGGGSGEICTPNRHGETMLMGDLLKVSGSTSTRLDAAYLRNDRNLRIESAWVIPVDDKQTYITMGTLEESSMARRLWPTKHSLDDYEIQPGEVVNVVLEVEVLDPHDEASTEGMAVEYSVGSKSFVTESKMSYKYLTASCLSK